MYATGTAADFEESKQPCFPAGNFLAGGLTPENLRELPEFLHPYAVDLSSGVETDGYKDPQKMQKVKELMSSYT